MTFLRWRNILAEIAQTKIGRRGRDRKPRPWNPISPAENFPQILSLPFKTRKVLPFKTSKRAGFAPNTLLSKKLAKKPGMRRPKIFVLLFLVSFAVVVVPSPNHSFSSHTKWLRKFTPPSLWMIPSKSAAAQVPYSSIASKFCVKCVSFDAV